MKNMTYEMWKKAFPERMQYLLEKSGMTQRELADKVGVSEVSMSRYINGERIPRGPVLVNISRALKVPVSWVLIVDDYMTPSR